MTLLQSKLPVYEFPLLEDVIVLTNVAMQAGEPAAVVDALVSGLANVVANPGEIPTALLTVHQAGYVRRELYRSDRFGYQIIAITWNPGQGSPVHDHADTWGIEAVLRGRLRVQDYVLGARHRALTELYPAQQHMLVEGTVLGLLPPHDLHACSNASDTDVALSLHIYGKDLQQVKRYVHVDGVLYRPQRVMMGTVN